MSATQLAQTVPPRALPHIDDLEVEAQTDSQSGGAVNASEADVLIWQLDEDGWD